MEYELKALEHIVFVALHPKLLKKENRDIKYISNEILTALTEVARIKLRLIEASFEHGGDERFKFYIRQHQISLIQIVDTLYYFQQPKRKVSIYQATSEISVLRLYTELFETIEELLNFIESHFYNQFDQEANIPVAYQKIMAAEIKGNLKYLQREFLKMEVHPEFIKIILQPFEAFSIHQSVVTYRELLFLKELQRELLYLLTENNKPNFNNEITNLLLYLNYNSIRFYSYYIIELQEMAKKCTSTTDLIDFYSLKIKLINQQPVKPRFIYKADLPSIKDQIGSWISEELYFLEKRRHLTQQIPVNNIAMTDNEPKVHTSLSVAHLSLAVKLLIDAKVITNKNSTELFKIVARNFRTDRREQISEDSLRNKAYNIESSSVDGMKDVIIGLMNLVRKY